MHELYEHKAGGRTWQCRDFPNADEFWDQVNAKAVGKFNRTSRDESDRKTEWTGTESFGAALDLARNGWAEGVAMCESLTNRLTCSVGSMVQVPEVVFDVTGDCMDMGAVMEGCPEHWMSDVESEEEVRDQSHGRMIRITTNLFSSCGVSPENMRRKASAIAACVALIEQSGRCAEVVGSLTVEGSVSDDWSLTFPIKRADEPLQLDRLAFACGHPSMFRRILFSLGETLPEGKRYGYHGEFYGTPAHMSESHPLYGDLHFDGTSSRDRQDDFRTDKAAQNTVIRRMKQLRIIESDD